MGFKALAVFAGFLSGYLSGQFGIGGGLITTPVLRLILHQSPYIALGTPLVVVIPTSLAGAFSYFRRGLVEVKFIFPLALGGVFGALLGSYATLLFPGSFLMFLTALIILLMGLRFLTSEEKNSFSPVTEFSLKHPLGIYLVGLISGFFSGFLGLGGGFLLIPALVLILKEDVKKAFGTSLAVISFYAFPGALIHYFLGHVNLNLAFLLILGVLPGVYLGSWATSKLSSKSLKLLFGMFLLVVALYFAFFEVKFWI